MNVQVSVPTTSAIASLVGCFLLLLTSLGIVWLAKKSEDVLQERANAEILTEAMMNRAKYPPWMIKMEIVQATEVKENAFQFPLHELRVQSMILHHNEEQKHAFHVGFEGEYTEAA